MVHLEATMLTGCYHRAEPAVACILPNIASDFGSSSLSWVGTAYLLTQTTFSPMYGRMSDVFGRKVSHPRTLESLLLQLAEFR